MWNLIKQYRLQATQMIYLCSHIHQPKLNPYCIAVSKTEFMYFKQKRATFILSYCWSSVLEHISRVKLCVKVNRLEHLEGKIICTSRCSTMRRWSHPFPVWWLAANPGEAMLAYIYAGPLIGNFNLLADASQAAESVSIVYYFLLSIRAVASSVTSL